MKDHFIINCMIKYFDKNIFSKYQCGFRKGFSTQHALLVMLEKMKIPGDRKGFCAVFLAELSKLLTLSVMITSLRS